jgi:hypothetical protein
MDAARLAALRLSKLRALAPIAEASGQSLASGPVVRDGADAWAMIDDPAALEGAVVWALRNQVQRLEVVVEADETTEPASVARAAAALRDPRVRVWEATANGPSEVAMPAAVPAVPPPVAPLEAEPLLAVFREHGVDPVVEDEAIIGEIAGLEVARIDLGGERPELSVGVGQFDRDLNDMLVDAEGTEPVVQLAAAARAVRRHRRPGAAPHPLNRLRRERWLRSMIVAEPGVVGCTRLVPVPPLPVEGLRAPSPAPALEAGDASTLVVCSSGVDPSLALTAAILRRRYAPDARLVLVIPTADDYPVTRELAAALEGSVEVQPVVAPWLGS